MTAPILGNKIFELDSDFMANISHFVYQRLGKAKLYYITLALVLLLFVVCVKSDKNLKFTQKY
jgi:hypothetical protein